MADFYLGQGDLPLWQETLVDENGDAVNINGLAVTMTMIPLHGGSDVLTNNAVQNLDDGTLPNRGRVQRQMLAGETDDYGDYLVRVVATGGGHPISFPNTGYFLWTITPTAVAQQRRYLGIEEFKAAANLQNLTYLDSEIDTAIEAASRALESLFNGDRPWTLGPAAETRYFTRMDERRFRFDAIQVTSIALDWNAYSWDKVWPWGSGSYSVPLPPTDYRLLPVAPTRGLFANGGDGQPWESVELVRGANVWRLPKGRDAIRVTGQFGWEVIPAGVKAATQLVTDRFLRRVRQAPFGLASFGQDGAVATVRQIATDPDILAMLEGVRTTPRRMFA